MAESHLTLGPFCEPNQLADLPSLFAVYKQVCFYMRAAASQALFGTLDKMTTFSRDILLLKHSVSLNCLLKAPFPYPVSRFV